MDKYSQLIEKLELIFSSNIDRDEIEINLEKFLNQYGDNPDWFDFRVFIKNSTDLAFCDYCNSIQKNDDLIHIYQDGFTDEDTLIASYLLGASYVCPTCINLLDTLATPSLDDIKTNLSNYGTVFRPGNYVVFARKIYKVEQCSSGYYYLEGLERLVKEDEIVFDAINYALCNEYANIVDEYTDRIDEYDELNTPDSEGILEIGFAIREFGYKNEFIEDLKSRNYEMFVPYIEKAVKEAEKSLGREVA